MAAGGCSATRTPIGQITAALAARIPAAVFSVDYRLAPEHRFPAAFEDGYAALCQVFATAADHGVDRRRIALAGDSAGANLAAAIALAARDRRGPPVAAQALIYGVFSTDFDRPSCWEHAEAPFLSRASMFEYVGAYLGGPVASDDPYVAPIAAASHADLPAAFIAAAGIDPLRDDSAVYAELLRAAGVPVEHRCAPGLDPWLSPGDRLLPGGRSRIRCPVRLARRAAGCRVGPSQPGVADEGSSNSCPTASASSSIC